MTGQGGPRRRAWDVSGGVLAAVEGLPESALTELGQAIRAEAKERGLFLVTEEKKPEPIPIAVSPWVFRPEAARYLQVFFRGIRRTVNRILARYFEDPRLQDILPLRESELQWLRASCPGGIPRPQTVFERFDTNLGFQHERQLAEFQIIEFNAVGVGCVYLAPTAAEILEKHLLPRLKEALPELSPTPPDDYRHLLLQELQSHARAIERPACRAVALLERREATPGGCDEFSHVASYFESKGVPAGVGDPREVEQKDGEVTLKGRPVDVLYRDFQIEEVVSIKTHGGSVEGLEAAFARNQVVSTVFGEFDHKSLCELLSNPDFYDYFTPAELRVARRRIPWTRLLEERKTADPAGKEVDLVPYVRDHPAELVLKPNRGYGGEGVVVGQAVEASAWEQALEKALSKPKTWVVQGRVSIGKAPLIVLGGDGGRPQVKERYVTLGVTATARGVSFVGRCSDQPVVNVSLGGGLVPVFLAGKRA